MLGPAMPESYGRDDAVDEYRVKRGVAFQWHETKSVKFWTRFFSDIPGLTHIMDLGVGTAAAGIAAWRCNAKYEAMCANQVHKDWLDNLMDSCMFAVVADTTAGNNTAFDKDFQTKVRHLFAPQVSEGMRMIVAKAKGGPLLPEENDPTTNNGNGGEGHAGGGNDSDED